MKKRLSLFVLGLFIVLLAAPYARISYGEGTISTTKDDMLQDLPTTDPFNDRMAVLVGSDGRFNIGAFPDPATGGSTSGSWNLTYRWPGTPGTSFTTFRIDGADNIYGASGTVVQAPADIDSRTNKSSWKVGDIEITQTLQVVLNNQTNKEDVARISYDVKNTGSVAHEVGGRVMLDTDLNYNDGAPFRVPGDGIITTEKEYIGLAVPDTFAVYYNVTDNEHVATATLKSGGATPPDRFVLAYWVGIKAIPYDYAVTPGRSLTSDSAYAVYWNPAALAPGESRTYTTFYGLAQLHADLTPPLALGVTAPATLSVISNAYSPNPFTITATVFNNGSAAAENVELTLTLPEGLSLASGTSMQYIGNLAVGQDRQISWVVNAARQNGEKTLAYSVGATASNTPAKNMSGQIVLPAAFPLDLPQCSDGIDNDGDGKIDINDQGCLVDGVYDASLNSENQKPVITINETDPLELTVGEDHTFNVTATDSEDGDISDKIIYGGSYDPETTIPGNYTKTFTVTDSGGMTATKTLQIIVKEALDLPQCSDGKDNDGDGSIDVGDAGCHADGNAANSASYDPQLENENQRKLSVPYYSQGGTDWCVPTSMSMVLKYYGKNIHSWDIAKDWGLERGETLWPAQYEDDRVAEYFMDRGLTSSMSEGDNISFDAIKSSIDSSNPMFLSMRSNLKHAVVIIGYEIVGGKRSVYVNDPSAILSEKGIGYGNDSIARAVEWDDLANYLKKDLLWTGAYVIIPRGIPNPPKGTIDINTTGKGLFFYETNPNRRIESYAYGKGNGIGWKYEEQLHPFELTNKDIVAFEQNVTNSTGSAQKYKLRMDFVDSQLSVDSGGSMGFAQGIKTVDEYHSEDGFIPPEKIQDILLNSSGEYKIVLTLWGGEGFTEKYDEIIFPNIKYIAKMYAPNPYGYSFRNRGVQTDIPNTPDNEGLTNLSKWIIFNNVFDLSGVDSNTVNYWQRYIYEGGGNCYGMSASSLMEYAYPAYDQFLENDIGRDHIIELDQPPYFDSEQEWDGRGDISEKPILEHIMEFQMSWLGIPEKSKIIGVANVVDILKTGLPQQMYILNITDENKGHALVPFRIESVTENQEYKIFVYDPNHPYPDDYIRSVTIKKDILNRWQWEYDLGWITWSGNGDSIDLIPISAVYNNGNKLRLPTTNNTEEANVFSSGEVDLSLVDSEGRISGLKDGSSIEEIPNVKLIFPVGVLPDEELGKWQPSFYISDDTNLGYVIEKNKSDEEFSLIKFGNGYFVEFKAFTGAEDIKIDISQDGKNISISGQEDGYSLFLNRNIEGVSLSFNAPGIPTAPNETHIFSVDWQALARGENGVTMKIDKEGDGVFEKTVFADKTLEASEITASNPVIPTNTGGGGGIYTATSPTDASVAINNGESVVENAKVNLTLSASGAAQMAISNSPDFADVGWEDFKTVKEWDLSAGVGEKIVYVKFRSANGGVSSVVSDSINRTEGKVQGAATVNILDGDIIQCKSSADPFAVYIVKTVGDKKYIRHIVSPEIFNHYGHLKWGNIVQVDSLDGYSLSGWVRVNTGINGTAGANDKVYEINGDQTKHWINMTAQQFLTHGGSEEAIYSINQGELDLYGVGADVTL